MVTCKTKENEEMGKSQLFLRVKSHSLFVIVQKHRAEKSSSKVRAPCYNNSTENSGIYRSGGEGVGRKDIY